MPPQDPTPLGDAMTHRFPEQKMPEPKPSGHVYDELPDEQEPETRERPAVPDEGVHRPDTQRG